jgi:hypothetical protein
MIRVVCTCGRAFKAEDRHAGKHTKCPECGADLTIGSARISSSSGADVNEVPAWWYPSDPETPDSRATAPTRSDCDAGPDKVKTMVLPPEYDHTPKRKASSQTTLGSASAETQSSHPKSPFGAQVQDPGRASFPIKRVWAIAGGAALLLVLAVGTILWLRSATRGADAVTPVPWGNLLDKPDNLGATKVSPPSAPGRNPKPPENGIVIKSTGDATPKASSSVREVGVAEESKTAPAGASRRLRLLVPAYIYPVGGGLKDWQRLFEAATKVEIVAIANPNSGPGDQRNLDYAAIYTKASNQGITLVGYVSTDYCRRPQAAIKNDVDTWVHLYPQIRGFFFDQQPRDGRDAVRFAELRDYVKVKIRDPLVITNPGTLCDEEYLAQAVSNVTCVFDNYQGFEQFELPAPLKEYEPFRFATIPYNVSDVETMRKIVKDAIIKRIGYLYISDAKPPNRWDKLPIYWEEEVDAVSHAR